MFENINDIDDADKDYFAHYDFEFAKSGTNHANFEQKWLQFQKKAIEKAKERIAKGEPVITQQEMNSNTTDDSIYDSFKPKPAGYRPAEESDSSANNELSRAPAPGPLPSGHGNPSFGPPRHSGTGAKIIKGKRPSLTNHE